MEPSPAGATTATAKPRRRRCLCLRQRRQRPVCGVQIGGTVACWGTNTSGEATPPTVHSLRFPQELDSPAGEDRWNYRLLGINILGESTPPPVRSPPSARATLTAVRSEDRWTIVCWGTLADHNHSDHRHLFIDQRGRQHDRMWSRNDSSVVCWGSGETARHYDPDTGYWASSPWF